MAESPLMDSGGATAVPMAGDGYSYYYGDANVLYRTIDGVTWESWTGSQWISNTGGNDGYRASPAKLEDAALIVRDGYPWLSSLGGDHA